MVIRMATSSIFRNIIIEDEEKIEKFVEALEKSKAQAENRKVAKAFIGGRKSNARTMNNVEVQHE